MPITPHCDRYDRPDTHLRRQAWPEGGRWSVCYDCENDLADAQRSPVGVCGPLLVCGLIVASAFVGFLYYLAT